MPNTDGKKHLNVVAAAIRYRGRILCMQRGETRWTYTSYKWELPGGKIEPGETPEEALRREIREELALDVRVGERLCQVEHAYPDFQITLQVYLCDTATPRFTLREHHAYLWLTPHEMPDLDWAEADRRALTTLTL